MKETFRWRGWTTPDIQRSFNVPLNVSNARLTNLSQFKTALRGSRTKTAQPPCSLALPHHLLLMSCFMAVGIHKCCITAICSPVPGPHSFLHCHDTFLKCARLRCFLNVAAWVNSENHERRLKGYPSNLPRTVCEGGLKLHFNIKAWMEK